MKTPFYTQTQVLTDLMHECFALTLTNTNEADVDDYMTIARSIAKTISRRANKNLTEWKRPMDHSEHSAGRSPNGLSLFHQGRLTLARERLLKITANPCIVHPDIMQEAGWAVSEINRVIDNRE